MQATNQPVCKLTVPPQIIAGATHHESPKPNLKNAGSFLVRRPNNGRQRHCAGRCELAVGRVLHVANFQAAWLVGASRIRRGLNLKPIDNKSSTSARW
jgi:hypothetical protein